MMRYVSRPSIHRRGLRGSVEGPGSRILKWRYPSVSSAHRRTGQKLRKRPTEKQLLTALEQQLYFSLLLLHASMTVGTHRSQSLSCPRRRHGEHAAEICTSATFHLLSSSWPSVKSP